LISRSDILRAYDVGIVRKQRGQLLAGQTILRREQRHDFLEFRLNEGGCGVGQQLKDMVLSHQIKVVSVEREGLVLIAEGKTTFAGGDIITLFGRREMLAAAQQVFSGEGE
jgi:CIC family chloride channel protein